MRVERVLTWVSRALFAGAGLSVVGLTAYAVNAGGSTDSGMDNGRMRVFALFFCSIAWCLFAGGMARTLTTATSWPRALLDIASTVGFGLFFTAIALLIFGTWSVIPAVPIAIGGFVVTSVAKVVAFIAFGAKEAVGRIEAAVAQAQHSIADERVQGSLAPPVPHPGFVEPAGVVFTPEPMELDRPSPGSQV